MRISIVLPTLYQEFYYDRFRKVFQEEFPSIDVVYLFYTDYTQAPDLLRGRQAEFDAVIFAGAAAFRFCENDMVPETLWAYLPAVGSAVYRALMLAQKRGWDITRLSFDTYEYPMLLEVYQELGYQESDLHIQCFSGNPQNPDYNQMVYAFHCNALRNRQVCGCITRLNAVAARMAQTGVDHEVAFPTYNTIREQVDFMQRLYNARKSAEGEFVALLVSISFPHDLSTSSQSNYRYAMNRMRISSQVYRYADLIRGCVVELGNHDLMIFASRNVVVLQLQLNQQLPLLEWLRTESPYPFFIGIGFASTLSQAQYHANLALQRSFQERKSCMIMLYPDGSLHLTYAGEAPSGRSQVESFWMQVAETTGLSYDTVSRIAAFARQRESSAFTSQELADVLHIGKRSADRILEKLEINGYAAVIGRTLSNGKGRPSRKIQVYLTK